MSIDRRIVSILYYNGIEDVNLVEKFIGEKNNYYQVMINNEILNLKIPGKHYIEVFEDLYLEEEEYIVPKIENEEEVNLDSFEEELKKDEIEALSYINDQVQKPFEQKTFEEEEVKEIEKEIKKSPIVVKTKTVTTKVTTKKVIEPKITKKIKNVDTKKVDNDIDDFINLA